jgi:hypothetical protein
MNNFYKPLPNLVLRSSIVDKIQSQIENKFQYYHWLYAAGSENQEYFDESIEQYCLDRNAIISDVEIFVTPPRVKSYPHVDDIILSSNMTKLNFIFGAKNSYMSWYAVPENVTPEIKTDPYTGGRYLYVDEEQLVEIHRERINYPSIVNAGIFHNVQNLELSNYRICVSYVLHDKITNKYIEFSDAITRFN